MTTYMQKKTIPNDDNFDNPYELERKLEQREKEMKVRRNKSLIELRQSESLLEEKCKSKSEHDELKSTVSDVTDFENVYSFSDERESLEEKTLNNFSQ